MTSTGTPIACLRKDWRDVYDQLPADLLALPYWALRFEQTMDPHWRAWFFRLREEPIGPVTAEQALSMLSAAWLDLASWHGPVVANDPSRGSWRHDRRLWDTLGPEQLYGTGGIRRTSTAVA